MDSNTEKKLVATRGEISRVMGEINVGDWEYAYIYILGGGVCLY